MTTVVYTGDPLAPATLTKVATQQGYFPEWVITGTALIDTDVLARTYDQQQWAHAFGPADLFVRSRSGATRRRICGGGTSERSRRSRAPLSRASSEPSRSCSSCCS